MSTDIENLQALRRNINKMSETRTPRVLIVEDNVFDSEILTKQLKDQCIPANIDICRDALSAEKMLHEKTYELVMLDLMLPGMNGVQLLKRLPDNIKNTHFIAVSGLKEDDALMREALEAGAFAVMNKPFSDPQIHGLCGLI